MGDKTKEVIDTEKKVEGIVEPVIEKKPEVDLESKLKELEENNKKDLKEALAKEKEDAKKAVDDITKSFDDKFKALQEDAKKERETFEKLMTGLKEGLNKDDILKEIEDNKVSEEKARKDKELLEMVEESKKARVKAESEKAELEKLMKTNSELAELNIEKEKFKTELLKEAGDKPWLADKIKKVLIDEDYDIQKTEYRFLKKFFDTEEEEQRHKAKSKAGQSAFNGVTTSGNQKGDSDIKSFTAGYIDKMLKNM